MINVVLPMAGASPLAKELDYPYPSPLVEIGGVPLIEKVLENVAELGTEIRLTAILRQEDCRTFHLDDTIRMLAGETASIVELRNATAGALCSILMAVESINSDTPLVIANIDQIFDAGVLSTFIETVRRLDADAACPVFNSVHPRWCFLRSEGETVLEAAEKKPISRNAVAGLYYFKSGSDFVTAAMQAIVNSRDTDGQFYISSSLNEFILAGKRVVGVPINTTDYHSFFTAQRVTEYENKVVNSSR